MYSWCLISPTDFTILQTAYVERWFYEKLLAMWASVRQAAHFAK